VSQLEKLGKYEIRRTLGEGGMGVVYEGFDPQIQRRVALKAIRAPLLEEGEGTDPHATLTRTDKTRSQREQDTLRNRFQREAQAAGRLAHPRIVTVFEYGEDVQAGPEGGEVRTPYIAMEFVEGRELKKLLDATNERLPLPQVLRMMDELLDALGYSHTNGVVHRDIKPANIMVLADGSIKVADFGIARVESSTLTQLGSVFGTPHYMAPEQLEGRQVDGRADLWAAGVVLYELLTGDRPFTGTANTVMARVLNPKDKPVPPSQLSVSLPKVFDRIVERALAKRPEERYQSAAEFRQALQAVTAGGAGIRPGGNRRLLMIGSVAAAMLLAVAGASVFFMRGKLALPDVVNLAPAPALTSTQTPTPALASAQTPTPAPASAQTPTPAPAGTQTPTPAPSSTQAPPRSPAPTDRTARLRQPAQPGIATITAVGLVPAMDAAPQAVADRVREDATQRLVAKAAALFVDPSSLSAHYPLLRSKLFSHSGMLIKTILSSDTAPQRAAAGMMFQEVRANLDVRAVHKLLNEVAEKDSVDLMRNPASPKVSVRINTQDADAGATSAQRSEVAENIIKERINSYGFVVVDGPGAADFQVEGTAGLKRLSARLPASGLTIEMFVLTYWTIKATAATSGEQIYFSTRIPEKQRWASRELALQAIGRLVGDELSEGLFLKNFDYPPRRIQVRIEGLAPESVPALLPWLHTSWLVLDAVVAGTQEGSPLLELDLAGGARELTDLIEHAVVIPLNQQLERACLSVVDTSEALSRLRLDPACNDALRKAQIDEGWGPAARRQAWQAPELRFRELRSGCERGAFTHAPGDVEMAPHRNTICAPAFAPNAGPRAPGKGEGARRRHQPERPTET
jgi:serine/threonine-protein kinase